VNGEVFDPREISKTALFEGFQTSREPMEIIGVKLDSGKSFLIGTPVAGIYRRYGSVEGF